MLCASVPLCSGFQGDAGEEQRGEEEGRRPLQVQSRTVTVAQKDIGTPQSYRADTEADPSDSDQYYYCHYYYHYFYYYYY